MAEFPSPSHPKLVSFCYPTNKSRVYDYLDNFLALPDTAKFRWWIWTSIAELNSRKRCWIRREFPLQQFVLRFVGFAGLDTSLIAGMDLSLSSEALVSGIPFFQYAGSTDSLNSQLLISVYPYILRSSSVFTFKESKKLWGALFVAPSEFPPLRLKH